MLPLKRVLKSIETGLEMLTRKTKDMQKLVDNLEEAFAIEQVKTRTRGREKRPSKKKPITKKPTKKTATNTVTTEQIKAKTGFDEKKIWGIINRLKKTGKVKSAGRGVYMKS